MVHIFVCCRFIVTIIIIIILLSYSFLLFFVHTCDLSLKHSEIQPKLVKHGVFPFVSVQVQHGGAWKHAPIILLPNYHALILHAHPFLGFTSKLPLVNTLVD